MRLDTARMPPGRTVLAFEFTGAPTDCRRFWLVHENGVVDMCLKQPGYEVDMQVAADLRLFIEAWRGIRDLRREIRRSPHPGIRPARSHSSASRVAPSQRARTYSAAASRARAAPRMHS